MKRALLWFAAVLAAAVGVWLYARDPRPLTYVVHAVLFIPFYVMVILALGRTLPYRLQWMFAFAIAPLGAVAYMVWPGDQWWFYGGLSVLPLTLLVEQRGNRVGSPDVVTEGGFGDPFGPP